MPVFIKNIFLVLLFSIINCAAFCQIGIGVNPPAPSAMLHVQDTAKGLLIPRMTDAQRINIQNPAEGLMVYQTDSPAGFWYYRSGKWVNTFPSNGGRSTIVLSDTITNAEAQLKIANEVGPNTEEVRILRCSNLTTVDLSMLTNRLLEVYIDGNPVLQNVNMGNLTSIDGGIYINNCPQLTVLDVHSLRSIGQTFSNTGGAYWGINITASGIQDINFPEVKQVVGQINIQNNPALTNLGMPQLLSGQSITISNCPLLANASFHALKNLAGFNMFNPAEMATIDFSSLITIGGLTLKANQLSSVSLPALTTASQIDISAPQLGSASFPVLQACLNFTVNAASQLSTVSAPLLLNSKIQITGGSLNAVNFNSLQTSTGITISATAGSAASIAFPALQTVLSGSSSAMNVTGIGTLSFPILRKTDGLALSGISSLSVPLLDTAKYLLEIKNSPALSTLLFPALKKCGIMTITNCGMTSVSFPAFITTYEYQVTGSLGIYSNPNLTSISWPNLQVCNYGYFENNKLPSSQVNALLAKFRTITVPNNSGAAYLYLMQIPAAPPTGQGIIDKNYLIGLGVYVYTD